VEEAMTEATRRAGLEHDGEAMLLSLRSLMSAYLRPGTWPLWRLAEHVTAPTLLVYGLKDRLVDPRTATRAAKAIPDSRLVVVPDSGHVTQMEHPELVAREVRRLLASAGSPARPPAGR
jgi:pimeloyl-ACP methyl ester carboxylesterase